MLSETDAEAKKLLNALNHCAVSSNSRTGIIARTKQPRIRISGPLFKRWLCKTFCNFLSVNRTTPPQCFVEYAFAKHNSTKVEVLCIVQKGDKLLGNNRILGLRDFFDENGRRYALLSFFGMNWIVANFNTCEIQVIEYSGENPILIKTRMNQPKRFGSVFEFYWPE